MSRIHIQYCAEPFDVDDPDNQDEWAVYEKDPQEPRTLENWCDQWWLKYPAFPGEREHSQSHAERAANLMNAEASELNQLRNQVQILDQWRAFGQQLVVYMDKATQQDDPPEDAVVDLEEFSAVARQILQAEEQQPFLNVAQLLTHYQASRTVLESIVGRHLNRAGERQYSCKACDAVFHDMKGSHAPGCWMPDAEMLLQIKIKGVTS